MQKVNGIFKVNAEKRNLTLAVSREDLVELTFARYFVDCEHASRVANRYSHAAHIASRQHH